MDVNLVRPQTTIYKACGYAAVISDCESEFAFSADMYCMFHGANCFTVARPYNMQLTTHKYTVSRNM